ncbi:MAG: DnaJ domain-containing protein, partial [candidate division NC10 bacterium]
MIPADIADHLLQQAPASLDDEQVLEGFLHLALPAIDGPRSGDHVDARREAPADEVKRAFKKLALKYHPDRNPDNRKESEERFKEIAEAYEVVGDPQKRSRFDQFGVDGLRGTGFRPF